MSIISPLPFSFTNGSTADANQVNANFAAIVNSVNSNAAPLASVPAAIQSLPFSAGLSIQVTGNTTVNIKSGYSMVSVPGQWTNAVISNTNVTITFSNSAYGANGIDAAGNLSASTWYYLFIIYNGGTVAGLASKSASAPVLPPGYTYLQRVGAVSTDGSANLISSCQTGNHAWWTSGVVTGATTDVSIGTPTLLNIASTIPPTANEVVLTASTSAGTVTMGLQPVATVPDYEFIVYHNFGAGSWQLPVRIPIITSQSVYWEVSFSGSLTVSLGVLAWTDAVGAV